MGGLGSGGSNRRWRGTVEGCRRLEACKFTPLIAKGGTWEGSYAWTDGDGTRSSVGISGDGLRIKLAFNARVGDGDWQRVEQAIALDRVQKPLGGSQTYLRCPRCHRRCRYLYNAQAAFWCRLCSRLTHASSRERHSDRALRQARKIRRRLGAEPGFDYPAFRPKHMHQATYERLYEQLQTKEAESWDDALRLLQRLQKSERRISTRRGERMSLGKRQPAFW